MTGGGYMVWFMPVRRRAAADCFFTFMRPTVAKPACDLNASLNAQPSLPTCIERAMLTLAPTGVDIAWPRGEHRLPLPLSLPGGKGAAAALPSPLGGPAAAAAVKAEGAGGCSCTDRKSVV